MQRAFSGPVTPAAPTARYLACLVGSSIRSTSLVLMKSVSEPRAILKWFIQVGFQINLRLFYCLWNHDDSERVWFHLYCVCVKIFWDIPHMPSSWGFNYTPHSIIEASVCGIWKCPSLASPSSSIKKDTVATNSAFCFKMLCYFMLFH